ncbi:MAG: hypothetical protein KatS3mg115_2432 [Candidatus Poribacteria bacterium]|nr:MAG: hypothetical protein KatS3mg115_2432 [Candidatus Poribacteria bacterium]
MAGEVGVGGRWYGVGVWDVATGGILFAFEPSWGQSVAFSPSGTVVAGGRYYSVSLWDLNTGGKIAELPLPGVAPDVEFSPNGELLAAAGSDGNVYLWDAASLQQLTVFQGHAGSVNSIAFSPDGTLLASGSSDETILLWDTGSISRGSFQPAANPLLSGRSGGCGGQSPGLSASGHRPRGRNAELHGERPSPRSRPGRSYRRLPLDPKLRSSGDLLGDLHRCGPIRRHRLPGDHDYRYRHEPPPDVKSSRRPVCRRRRNGQRDADRYRSGRRSVHLFGHRTAPGRLFRPDDGSVLLGAGLRAVRHLYRFVLRHRLRRGERLSDDDDYRSGEQRHSHSESRGRSERRGGGLTQFYADRLRPGRGPVELSRKQPPRRGHAGSVHGGFFLDSGVRSGGNLFGDLHRRGQLRRDQQSPQRDDHGYQHQPGSEPHLPR